jgi:hypothetical protein
MLYTIALSPRYDRGRKAITHTLPFKSLASLRNVLVFERKAHFWSIKKHQIDQKHSVDMVNVENDYCSWKRQKNMEYLHRRTQAHYQQPSLLGSNGTLC